MLIEISRDFLSVFMEMLGKYIKIIQDRLLLVPLFMVTLPLSVNLIHYMVTCRGDYRRGFGLDD
jgi:hypothetical protein